MQVLHAHANEPLRSMQTRSSLALAPEVWQQGSWRACRDLQDSASARGAALVSRMQSSAHSRCRPGTAAATIAMPASVTAWQLAQLSVSSGGQAAATAPSSSSSTCQHSASHTRDPFLPHICCQHIPLSCVCLHR